MTSIPRRTAEDDSGVTLIELLVAFVLLAIMMTIVVSAFSRFSSSFSSTQSASESTNVASVAMNEVTRVIRSGTEIEVLGAQNNETVFRVATKEEILLRAYLDTDSLDPKPTLIQFKIDPVTRELVEKRWDSTMVNGYWTFPTITGPTAVAAKSTRIVARKLVVPTGTQQPMFTFLTTTGCGATEPTCDIVPAGGNALNAAELRVIVAVEVTMKVQADALQRSAPVILTNRVGIPNIGISRVGL